jgi:predicted nucleotide-binding protein (sugar kinase/HSP70/actin superfamily)
MIRKVREKYPNANIVAVDYDPGAPRVNQENRIKLMLSIAKENLEKEEAKEEKEEKK